jgi:iron complex transport system permease protein
LAGPRGGSLTLILAGIAISALAGALTSLVLNLSPNPFAVSETVFWMLGSLADRSFWHVWMALPFMALGWLLLALTARGLDALTLGEDAAASLGIGLGRLRLMIVFGRQRRRRGHGGGGRHRLRRACRAAYPAPVPRWHGPGLLLPASALGGAAWCWPPTSRCAWSCPTET